MQRAIRVLVVALFTLGLFAADRSQAQQAKNPELVKLFKSVIAKTSQSTVRVLGNGKEVALGTIITADGWILTKFSELKGDVTVKLPDGTEVDADVFGHDADFDLAMLKVDAKDLQPITLTDSKTSKIGHWVVSAGPAEELVALGVISVAAREVKGAKFTPKSGSQGGYLGIELDLDSAGIRVLKVLPKTPAESTGLKADDMIIALNGKEVQSTDDFLALLSGNKAGDEVKLKIVRNEKEEDYKIKLGTRPGTDKKGKSRSDQQNSMGSKLSERRAGFPIILQHDSVVSPTDCGGPLVNLEGQVLGINIARAGRVESYAIPSEAVRPLLEKLKMKKLEKQE